MCAAEKTMCECVCALESVCKREKESANLNGIVKGEREKKPKTDTLYRRRGKRGRQTHFV